MAMPDRSYAEETQTPKEDTLSSILGRIQGLLEQAAKNESRLENVRERIGGSVSEATGKERPPQDVSSHVIFMAHRIERDLDAHIGRVSGAITRMERLV